MSSVRSLKTGLERMLAISWAQETVRHNQALTLQALH